MSQKLSAYFFSCIIVSMSPLQAVAQQTQQQSTSQPSQWYGPGPWQMWNDGYAWQFWWVCLLMMLFMLVVVGCIFFFARSHLGNGPHHWGPPWHGASHSALQILNERFARGEIQRAEYEDRKVVILSGG